MDFEKIPERVFLLLDEIAWFENHASRPNHLTAEQRDSFLLVAVDYGLINFRNDPDLGTIRLMTRAGFLAKHWWDAQQTVNAANVHVDTSKVFWHNKADVRDLDSLLRRLDGTQSQNQIALEFMRGDKQAAQRLLKTVRRTRDKLGIT